MLFSISRRFNFYIFLVVVELLGKEFVQESITIPISVTKKLLVLKGGYEYHCYCRYMRLFIFRYIVGVCDIWGIAFVMGWGLPLHMEWAKCQFCQLLKQKRYSYYLKYQPNPWKICFEQSKIKSQVFVKNLNEK